MCNIPIARVLLVSLGLTTFLYGVSSKPLLLLVDDISIERNFLYPFCDHDGCHDPQRYGARPKAAQNDPSDLIRNASRSHRGTSIRPPYHVSLLSTIVFLAPCHCLHPGSVWIHRSNGRECYGVL